MFPVVLERVSALQRFLISMCAFGDTMSVYVSACVFVAISLEMCVCLFLSVSGCCF